MCVIFCKMRMSEIRLTVGHYDLALEVYKEVIKLLHDSIVALRGIAKTEIQLAHNNLSNGLFESGNEHCLTALK